MTEAALVAALPGWAFAFALVLCRTGAAIMLLPGLGETEAPPTLRAGFAMALSALLLPAVAPSVPLVPPGLPAAGMILAELLTGAALGWLARLPVLALGMAGAMASYVTGLASVVQTDPALGGQTTALARGLGLAAPVLVLSTGLYALPLQALAGSYALVPLGAALPAGPLAESVADTVTAALGLALRLSAPFLAAGLVFQAALGLLARVAPQLQLTNALTPGQILGGLALLGLLAARLLAVWQDGLASAWAGLPGL